MGGKIKSISLAAIMVLSTMSGIMMAAPAAATQVVITEAIQVVDGGGSSDRMASVASDSQGNVHVVWSRSNQHLYYSMISPRGETLIDATHGFIIFRGSAAIQKVDDAAEVQFTMGDVLPETGC